MKILIDNKSFPLQGSFATFGEIINEVHKKLKTEDKLLESISVDGTLLRNSSIINVEKIKLVEITSKSHRSIIYASLVLLEEYIGEFFNSLESLESGDTDSVIHHLKLEEIFNFLNWSLNLLYSLKDNSSVEFLYEDFDEFLDEYREILENFYKALESQDYNIILEILEFDISDLLIAFRSNIESYKEDLILEENLSNNYC